MALPRETAAALDRLARFGMRLGLDRMRRLLAALGDPQRGLPAVLVGGTNGKGTVSALLASCATAARYRTGLYTSPHLETVEERLRLDGAAIDGERLGVLLARVLAAGDGALEEPPTYFEALTAAAFLWFAEESVDLAILEVGLGGRFDATNLAEPRLSVITSVDLDHREHLGDTLAAVSREKAGIMRPGAPVVTVGAPTEVAATLAEEADRIGALRTAVPERLTVEAVQRFRPFSDPPDLRQRVWLRDPRDDEDEGGPGGAVQVYETALAGRHQADNLAIAVAASEELRDLGWERLTPRAVKKGVRSCRWPGRLEEVRVSERAALPGGARVILDVAHNPGGAAALAVALDDLGEPVDLVFGVLDDKDATAMLALLAPRARNLTLTRPTGPRGRDPLELLPLVPGAAARVVEVPPAALDEALRRAEGRIVTVCGSLALVGEARAALRRRYGVPEPAVDVRLA